MEDPKPAPQADAARIRAVAETLRDLGMTVSAIVVGDIRIALAEPWGGAPARKPSLQAEADADQAAYVQQSTDAVKDEKLVRLRVASRKQFGKVLPDETLIKFDGILA